MHVSLWLLCRYPFLEGLHLPIRAVILDTGVVCLLCLFDFDKCRPEQWKEEQSCVLSASAGQRPHGLTEDLTSAVKVFVFSMVA